MGQRSWQERIGNQRDWIWRGWQTRYSYFPTQTISLEAKQTPLILIHGFGASIEHWRHNIPVLGQEYPVYALDLLGFGASRKADTEYTVKLWVEQVHVLFLCIYRNFLVKVRIRANHRFSVKSNYLSGSLPKEIFSHFFLI